MPPCAPTSCMRAGGPLCTFTGLWYSTRRGLPFECDDVIRRAHVSRNREQQAAASKGLLIGRFVPHPFSIPRTSKGSEATPVSVCPRPRAYSRLEGWDRVVSDRVVRLAFGCRARTARLLSTKSWSNPAAATDGGRAACTTPAGKPVQT